MRGKQESQSQRDLMMEAEGERDWEMLPSRSEDGGGGRSYAPRNGGSC